MREKSGTNVEIAKQYRGQLLNKLFGELYCGDEPMGRDDRYDKIRIKRIATEYLQGAGIQLAKSGTHANAVERVLRGIQPEERHEIPGAVMAVVVSEGMFRAGSVMDVNEKQELYARAYDALLQTELLYQRGGWARFHIQTQQRSELVLVNELNNPNLSDKAKQELLDLYDSTLRQDDQENNTPYRQEKPSRMRRFGQYLLRGLGATAGMIGPTEFGHERHDDNGDTNDD